MKLPVWLLVGLFAATAAGCDGSKEELETTRRALAEVNADRDALKRQVEQAGGQIASLQQQVTALQTKVAAAEQARAAPAAPKAKPTATSRAKKPARTAKRTARR
jgi:predicted  nucleic acid-binding Zn-ribbon protein